MFDTPSRRGHSQVHKLLSHPITYLELTLDSALVAIMELFVVFAFPGQTYYKIIGWPFGKLYSNSLMVRAVLVKFTSVWTNFSD